MEIVMIADEELSPMDFLPAASPWIVVEICGTSSATDDDP